MASFSSATVNTASAVLSLVAFKISLSVVPFLISILLAVHSLNCIECPAIFLTPSDAVHGGLGVLQKDDILILVSKGGGTGELVQLIPACRTKGATLIGITENENSEIGRNSDICLTVGIEKEPCRFNMLATASTLAVISVMDAVCIALMQYTDYTREQFAVIHPKGAVGERLLGGEK